MPKVALAGVGHIHTPNFVKLLKARSDFQVLAVWDDQPERGRKVGAELGAPFVADHQALWSRAELEAVVVCSETNRHEELVLAGAQHKKHLFVEKPLGFSGKDALRMARAIESAGVLFQTGYFMRGSPVHLFLKEHLGRGTFGRITRIRHSTCHSGSLRGLFDKEWAWMADPRVAGCGAFGDLGTHSLDILLWLLGPVAQVAASIGVATSRYGECDEYGEGLLRFQNQAVGTLAASWVDHANPLTVLVTGTEGHAYVLGGKLFLNCEKLGAKGDQPWTELPKAWPHAFDLFLDAVAGQAGVPLVGAREAAERSVVMDAFYEAARRGTWVAPDLGG